MGQRGPKPRLTTDALEEAEEAEDATLRLARMLRAAREDGQITPEELAEIEQQVDVVTKEVRDVVQATERADVAVLAAVSQLSGGINTSVRRRMQRLNLHVDPHVDPLTAA